MLILISPAKSLDFESARIIPQESFPAFTTEAQELVSTLQKMDKEDLMKLMSISDKLADLNYERFQNWLPDPDKELARQAVCAFTGDVYTGLDVKDWETEDFAFAQEHLRILSGLYGILRPLDYIAPYRLEMGSKLETAKGKNLYEFWDDKITQATQEQLNKQGDQTLLNLASNEYFKSIQTKKLKAEIITPVFKDFKNGQYKIISFFAKKARGMMVRYIIKNQLSNPEDLKAFDGGGYSYNDRLSKGNTWVFTRE